MKNLFKSVLLFICVVLLSGCVKMHTTMTINSDKSMLYEMEALISNTLAENGTEVVNETARKEYEDAGYKLEKIKDNNNYSGYKISKKFDSIDDLSNNNGEEVVISDFGDKEFDTSKVFKVEKGFLKNKYTATFKYKVSDLGGNTETDEDQIGSGAGATLFEDDEESTVVNEESGAAVPLESGVNDDEEVTTTDENETSEDEDFDMGGLEELMGMMKEMEFTYVVNLPAKSLSNNATKVENDGKTLRWELSTEADSDIKFSFELYNILNIALVCGGALLVIIVVVVLLVVKGKKKKEGDFTPTVVNDTTDGGAPITGTTTEEVVDSINTVAIDSVVNAEQPEPVEVPTLPEEPVNPEASEVPVAEPTPVVEEPSALEPPVAEATLEPPVTEVEPPVMPTEEPQPIEPQPVEPQTEIPAIEAIEQVETENQIQ